MGNSNQANKPNPFNWKEYSLKGIAGMIIGLAFLLLMFFIAVCFIYFPPRGMSSSLESLGLYGDYFGGIVGGITSIATLGVTIYLAMVLHRIEKENNESSINAQRKVAIMQIKFQELDKLKAQWDDDIDLLWSGKFEDLEGVHKSLKRSFGRIAALFPELQTEFEYYGFKVVLNSAMMVVDLSKEFAISVKTSNDPSVHDDITGKIVTEIQTAENEYYEVMKKLSKWAAE